jgi:hypothetical protein
MLRSALLCLIVTSSLSHAATVYRSIDSEGRVTYSDQPPLDKSTRVETLHYRETPVTAKITESRINRENTRLEQKARQPLSSEHQHPYYGPRPGGGRHDYPQYPYQPRWDLIGQPASSSDYPAKLVRQHYSDHVQRALQPNRVYQHPDRPLPMRPVPLR